MKKAIQMPAELAGKYRFTQQIFGGPVFDFPQVGLRKINLAALTPAQAARLLRGGWSGIELVPPIAEAKEAAPPRRAQKTEEE